MKRATPRTDAWVDALRKKLAKRGAKTALAKHLESETGTKAAAWKNGFTKFFRGESRPSAEAIFIIDEWLARQSSRVTIKH